MLQAIPALALCLDVGTGVMEGDMLNVSCCILFNLTWDYFLIYILSIVWLRNIVVLLFEVKFVCCRWSHMCWLIWICIRGHIVALPRLMNQM